MQRRSTQGSQVGTGTLAFGDCSNATLAYTFTDGSRRSGSIPLTRAHAQCHVHGGDDTANQRRLRAVGQLVRRRDLGTGLRARRQPAVSGGLPDLVHVRADGSGAGAAGQRWFVGLSNNFVPGNRTIALTLYETTGGLFDQVTNPLPTRDTVGSATVTFTSCTAAQVQFNFTGGSNAASSGTIALIRVGAVPPGCTFATTAPMPQDPMMPGYPGYPGY